MSGVKSERLHDLTVELPAELIYKRRVLTAEGRCSLSMVARLCGMSNASASKWETRQLVPQSKLDIYRRLIERIERAGDPVVLSAYAVNCIEKATNNTWSKLERPQF